MNADRRPIGRLQVALNRAALALALVLLAAIGAVWWRDRTRRWETPRWDAARFVALRPPAARTDSTWVVVANPDCGHCRARLAELLGRARVPGSDPAIAVLLVDERRRPAPPASAAGADGGLYWDSLSIWRRRWGHRVYGEVLVFARDGTLGRMVGPADEPDPARRR